MASDPTTSRPDDVTPDDDRTDEVPPESPAAGVVDDDLADPPEPAEPG